MNKKQYNNIIEHSLQYDCKNTANSLDTVRTIFNNMGVALPQGAIKEVYEKVSTKNYMDWRSCTMQEAQAAANNGTAAIGISEDRIVVLAATDEEEPVEETAEVMTITDNTPAVAVANLQYYSYGSVSTGQGGCGANIDIGNYNDRYTYELVRTFGFTSEVAMLIRSLYAKVDNLFCSETDLQKAWKCSRLLGGIVYGNDSSGSKANFKWKDVAGQVFSGTEINYFVNILGYTNSEYAKIRNAIFLQHNDSTTSDFAHMQITLSARLAYKLDLDGFMSNIGTFSSDENVSYLAGWLGDATITNDDGTTSFGDDDYCADLDSENIYRKIIQGYSSIVAINAYYSGLSSCCNRADIFLNHISYSTAKKKVFYELIDEELITLISIASQNNDLYSVRYYSDLLNDETYHWNTIKSNCPDTYDFLKSLQNRLANISHF